jgi:hypothetical protein
LHSTSVGAFQQMMVCIPPDLRTMALFRATRSLSVREDMAIETAILLWIDPSTITRVTVPDLEVEAAVPITIVDGTSPLLPWPHPDMNHLDRSLSTFDIIPHVGIKDSHTQDYRAPQTSRQPPMNSRTRVGHLILFHDYIKDHGFMTFGSTSHDLMTFQAKRSETRKNLN